MPDGPLWMTPAATRHQITCRRIRALCLADNALTDGDVALVCQGARGLPDLEKLDLSGNVELTNRAVAAVCQLLDTRQLARRRPLTTLSGAGTLPLPLVLCRTQALLLIPFHACVLPERRHLWCRLVLPQRTASGWRAPLRCRR